MKTLGSFARLGQVVWRTYGARGLGRRGLHEARRAAGAFRDRPAHPTSVGAAPAAGWPGPRAYAAAGYAPVGDFSRLTDRVRRRILARGERVRDGEYQAFGHDWRTFPAGASGWSISPDGRYGFPGGAWWTIPLLPPGADVKHVWEPARFGWVYDLIRAFHLTNDPAFARAFHARVAEWDVACPPFAGVHWSCGQEVAIRAIALLHGEASLPGATAEEASRVVRLLAWSGERIADAIGYGLSQRNNHGISESVGLVHLGIRLSGTHPAAPGWLARGRRLVDEQIVDQFATDGWYAQHSFVYLRVALTQAITAQQALRAVGLSLAPAGLERLRAAVRLLAVLADANTGAVPNTGANDGSQVLPLSSAPFDDFRPVLTHACLTLGEALPADLAPDDEVLAWFDAVARASQERGDGVWVGDNSGWVVVRHEGARVFLRAGSFRHRPSHMDLLHVTVAWDGRDLITDAGTYAYNAPDPWANGLTTARVHNAPVLDGAEPAVRGARFLWKDWPSARLVHAARADGAVRVVAEVPGRVRREVVVRSREVVVRDEVLDPTVRAVVATWLVHPLATPNDVVAGPIAQRLDAHRDSTDAWFSPTYGVRVPTAAVCVRRARSGADALVLVTRLRAPDVAVRHP